MPPAAEASRTEQPNVHVLRKPRRRVVLSGTLETLSGKHGLSIRNLSCKGALVEGANLPDIGRDGVLQSSRLDCYCRVIWSDGDRRGLEFDEEIDMGLVLELHAIIPDPGADQEAEAREWFELQGKFARI